MKEKIAIATYYDGGPMIYQRTSDRNLHTCDSCHHKVKVIITLATVIIQHFATVSTSIPLLISTKAKPKAES